MSFLSSSHSLLKNSSTGIKTFLALFLVVLDSINSSCKYYDKLGKVLVTRKPLRG